MSAYANQRDERGDEFIVEEDRYREHLDSTIGIEIPDDIDTIRQLSRGTAIRNNTRRRSR